MAIGEKDASLYHEYIRLKTKYSERALHSYEMSHWAIEEIK